MDKMIRKISLGIIGLLSALTILPTASCTAKKIANDDNTLEVYIWDQGYGTKWLNAMLKEFGEQDWVKEKYPTFNYHVAINDQQNYTQNRISVGKANTIDLFFGGDVDTMYGDDSKLLDLTEPVFNQKVPGEDILFKDKMRQDMLGLLEWRTLAGDEETPPKYYSVPWSFGTGIIAYNETLFEKLGLVEPRTSDEFIALMETVKNKNIPEYKHTHSIISSKVSYFAYLYHTWWGQYEGYEGYSNYFNAIDYDGILGSPEVIKQEGRLEALKVAEKMYKTANGYFDTKSTEFDFVAGQGRLFMGEGLMMINGDWFSCEMEEMATEYYQRGYEYTIGAMKIPVLSAVVNKTPSIQAVATAQSVTADQMLARVIDEVDAGATSSAFEGITQEDFDFVRTARGTTHALGVTAQTVIPSYATAKNLAVDFVRFMATDRANEIYAENTLGGRMAFNYDLKTKNIELYNKLSKNSLFEVQSDVAEHLSKEYSWILPAESTFNFVKYGGFSSMGGFGNVELRFMNDAKLTAADILQERYDYWTAFDGERWNTALKNAGML